MSLSAEVIATDMGFTEGPAWYEQDRSIVLVSVSHGLIYKVNTETGERVLHADPAGGPNAAAPATDGAAIVTQNGGFDFGRMGMVGLPPVRFVEPGIQLVRRNGSVEYLCRGGFNAPNDLVVAPSGRVIFTDPKYSDTREHSRLFALDVDGTFSVIATGFIFCNGVALEPDGNIVVIDRNALIRVHEDGSQQVITDQIGRSGGDGFCVDVNGLFYCAAARDHGVYVIDAQGKQLEFLELPGEGFTTNCCFGGPELSRLYVTDGLSGQLVAWDLPTRGLPLTPYPTGT